MPGCCCWRRRPCCWWPCWRAPFRRGARHASIPCWHCATNDRSLSLLHLLGEFVPELLYLRRDHVRTIWLPRIVGEVFLMVVFGYIERGCRRNLRHDLIGESFRGRQFANHLFRRGALL